MVFRRIFGKKEEESEEEVSEVQEGLEKEQEDEGNESESALADMESETSGAPSASTIPYHAAFQDRLEYMLQDSEIMAGLENTDAFTLEFLVLGERIWVKKDAMDEFRMGTGAISDEDVYIRISNDVAQELLGASTFGEFSDIYMRYYKNNEPGKFVKIELRQAISNLNRRGYARVPLLKLFIGAVR